MKICKAIFGIVGKHCVHIPDHIPQAHGLLEHVLPGTPDITLFHCLEIRKKLILCAKLIDRGEFPVNGTVLDQHIRILRGGIEGLKIHVHR